MDNEIFDYSANEKENPAETAPEMPEETAPAEEVQPEESDSFSRKISETQTLLKQRTAALIAIDNALSQLGDDSLKNKISEAQNILNQKKTALDSTSEFLSQLEDNSLERKIAEAQNILRKVGNYLNSIEDVLSKLNDEPEKAPAPQPAAPAAPLDASTINTRTELPGDAVRQVEAAKQNNNARQPRRGIGSFLK